MTEKRLVSVIVPTKNSRFLEDCLKSIKNQSYPNIELIVVDNFSDDETPKVAKKYADKFYQKGPERSTQRNYGAEKAEGEYYLFIDSDMELTKDVVKECVEVINSRKNIRGVIIPEISFGQGFWAKCKALERQCYIGDETIEAARFFDKEIFWEFNGYDEDIAGGGEDWDLPLRIRKNGHDIGRIQSIIKHNEGKLSLWKSLKKKYYYSQTAKKYLEKHPESLGNQFFSRFFVFFRNWNILSKKPLHCIGVFFMKFCEFGAGGLGYLKSRCTDI